ncbi:hypothetical protein DMI65_18035 [Escherichia coli]|nr:hypothetical protein [Escherichia coli]
MEGEGHENDKTRIDSSFCLLSGDVDLAKHLAEILPITCFVGEDWQQDFQPLTVGLCNRYQMRIAIIQCCY